MKKKCFSLFIGLLSVVGAQAQLSTNPDKFLGNITTSYQIDYGSEKFYQLWNQITPENESKWASVEGTRGTYNWASCDNINNYAKQHHFPFKFHTLVWGSQFPGWVKNLSVQERYEAIVKWMDAVKERYPNLELIDVVNEAVDGHQADSHYMSEALGGKGRTGYDWIIKAFQMAYERWPNAILIYNDFNTFQWNTDQYISLVRALRDAGAPVDAYGCQSHDLGGVNQSTFKTVMTKIQDALKMPMYITEYDIGDANDANQKWNYQQHFPVMWEADYCAGVTLWGYIYGKTWVTDGNSGLIKDGEDRPAMTWLREYMQSDAAKQAKSPFPGMKKEASIYVKPASLKVAKGDKLPVWVAAKLATKTIEKVELYMGSELVATMTEAPYVAEVSSSTTGTKTLKAVVTATDGSQYERLSRISVLSSTVARSPYNDVVPELPGVVEAMNYDNGAAGVSYDNAARTGVTKTGAWMEYTVDVKEGGLYSLDIELASKTDDGMFHLVDNYFGNMVFLSDFITVPNTGNTTDLKTCHYRLTTPLEAGRRTLCLCIDKGGFSVGKMTFTPLVINTAIRSSVRVEPATISVGEKTTITATSVVSKSTISNVRIFANGIAIDTLTEKPYTTEFAPTAKGTYTITAISTAEDGRESKIVTTTLTVNEAKPATGDPNFYVYLCFGQSNMEGNATPEAVDQTVDPRFQMLACVNFTSPQRTMGQWYTATPPIVRQGTGLGMADYFGRTMVNNLPENVKVGVVDVAIGGTKIEGFMQDEVAAYIASMTSDEQWLKNYFAAYNNDPYQRLVDMARKAQESGVIKGILLHQGESNNGQSDWPQKVKKVYDSLISDLGLDATEVPLFVGETVSQAAGGACWYHNTVIAKVPSVIPNSYVISSEGCPQKGDGLHFTAQGYRIMGSRYAKQALKLMGIETDEPETPSPDLVVDHIFTSLDEIGTTPFAIVNEEQDKAFFGKDNQNLGFDIFANAFADTNTGYLFKLEKSSADNGYLLRLIQPDGTPYSIWGSPGYLNSQPADQWCSFILGLNNQNGQDMKDGAVWDINYVSGRGFTMKNVGTGKYLHDAAPAMYDAPAYFNFCTLGTSGNVGIETPLTDYFSTHTSCVYNLQGVKVGCLEQWNALPRGIYIVGGKKKIKR